MATKSRQTFKEMSATALKEELKKLGQELMVLRAQRATQQLKNPLRLRIVRRDIARVSTYLQQHETRGEGQ